jgi:DNA-binding LacI/PurR family transcriptional regulator
MKKRFLCFLILFVFIAGCAGGGKTVPQPSSETPEESSAVIPEATPEPEPEGAEKVFGKADIKITVICEDDEDGSLLFLKGIEHEALQCGLKYDVVYTDDIRGAMDNGDADAFIVLKRTPEDIPVITDGSRVTVVAGPGGDDGGADVYLNADVSGAAEELLDYVLVYPNHDTPVRMLGMFTSRMSSLYETYSAFADDGKVFSKSEYAADEDTEDEPSFIESTLKDWYPGMIDALITDSGSIAADVIKALNESGRDDFEIFLTDITPEALSSMHEQGKLMAALSGINEAEMGRMAFISVVKLLAGEEAGKSVTVAPVLIRAEDMDGDDMFDCLLKGELDESFESEALSYLKEYHLGQDANEQDGQ